MSLNAGNLPLLYSYWRSSCSYRVRIALNLKKIPHNVKSVNLLRGRGEQHSSDFREVNPMQKVPALCIDGHTIVESLNIIHYLEETRPENPLMPTDFYRRAKVREICEMIQSGIQPLQNVGVLSYIETIAGKGNRLPWAQHWIKHGFTAIEKQLTACAGQYSVGDNITLADCFLVPQVFNARGYKVNLEQFPTIVRIEKELENHLAFSSAHPFNQPDCDTKVFRS